MNEEKLAELAIAKYARSLSEIELRLEIIEKGDWAFSVNNSGRLKVLSILLSELEARELATQAESDFKKEVDEAIASVTPWNPSTRNSL